MWLKSSKGLRGRGHGRGRRRAPPRVAHKPFDVPRVAGRELRRPCASSDFLLGGLAPLQRGLRADEPSGRAAAEPPTEHRRPCDVPDVGLICDFLWADPDACTQGWAESERGVSYTFGSDVVSKFLEDHDFDLMVRAHQVVEDGYEFFAQRQLVTLFSAPNYCGEFDNSGAVMSVDASLMCSFHILKPRSAAPGTPDTVGRGAR